MEEIYRQLGISKKVYQYGQEIEALLAGRFAEIDRNAEYNQLKAIKAMQAHKVSAECFMGSSGYGYNDLDAMLVLKDILSHVWNAEKTV